jgi:histone acetyltransferase (RNA polymerase elongator complex component)
MESELRALDEAQYDPREERRDQLKAFLAGTANTTNFGSTMAGGTLASLNMRKQQKAERRERLKDIFSMAERGMDLDTTLANGGLQLGQQMYSEAMANQRAALSAAASMRNAELNAEVRRGELEYNRLKDDRSFGLQERELEIQSVRNDVLGRQADAENDTRRFGAVSQALDRIQDQEAAVREYAVESSQLPTLQDSLLMATDADEAAQIEAAIAAEEARVNIRAEQIFDEMGGVEARDLLAAELLSFTGTGADMLSLEDIAGIEQLDEVE